MIGEFNKFLKEKQREAYKGNFAFWDNEKEVWVELTNEDLIPIDDIQNELGFFLIKEWVKRNKEDNGEWTKQIRLYLKERREKGLLFYTNSVELLEMAIACLGDEKIERILVGEIK